MFDGLIIAGGTFLLNYIAGKACDEGYCKVEEVIADRKRDPNHDIEKAILRSHYLALRLIIKTAEQREDFDAGAQQHLVTNAFTKISRTLDEIKGEGFAKLMPELVGNWRDVISGSFRIEGDTVALPQEAVDVAIEDLRGLTAWPERLWAVVKEVAMSPADGWAAVLTNKLHEALKTRGKFRDIYTQHVLNGQDEKLDSVLDGIDALQKGQDAHRAETAAGFGLVTNNQRETDAKVEKLTQLVEALSSEKKTAIAAYGFQANAVYNLAEKSLAPTAKFDELMLASIPKNTQEAISTKIISEKGLLVLAQKSRENVTNLHDAMAELERLVEVAIKVAEAGDAPSNLDEFVKKALVRIAEKTKEGAFEEARRMADDAFAKWQAEEEQKQAAEHERVAHSQAQGVKLGEAAIQQAILAGAPKEAAQLIWRMIELDNPPDVFEAIRNVQDEYYVRGRDKGAAIDLEISIELARLTANIAQTDDQHGVALNDLAISLSTLGERTGDDTALKQAVDAYQAALNVYTKEDLPRDWAMTQNNLGNALKTLGERAGDDTALKQAVDAYQAALTVCTKDDLPLQWATTQNNLGTALSTLGKRAGDDTALKQAVDAYQAALTVYTKDDLPLQWALTAENLGNVRWVLNEREEAAALYCEALSIFRQRDVPYNINKLENKMRRFGIEPD